MPGYHEMGTELGSVNSGSSEYGHTRRKHEPACATEMLQSNAEVLVISTGVQLQLQRSWDLVLAVPCLYINGWTSFRTRSRQLQRCCGFLFDQDHFSIGIEVCNERRMEEPPVSRQTGSYGQACMQCYRAKCRCVPIAGSKTCER